MKLEIGQLKHGWIPFSIGIGNRSYSFGASTILNDPLFDLLASVVWAVAPEHRIPPVSPALNTPFLGLDTRWVHFWLEPDWHTLLIQRMDNADSLRLTFYANHEGGLQVEEDDFRTSEHTAFETIEDTAFAKMVCRSIGNVARLGASDEKDNDWQHPSGRDLFQQLVELV